MKYNEIKYGPEARAALAAGIKKVADAVKTTLGPSGRLVVISKPAGPGTLTKDGVTVARSVHLQDKFEAEGAKQVIAVASKSNQDAGDGTTTATVLAQALVESGLSHIEAGTNPMQLLKGISKAVDKALEIINSLARDVTTEDEIRFVATISGNDEEVGNIIAEAIEKAGNEGVITIEEGKQRETSVVTIEGYQFDKGMVSPYFVTNTNRLETVYEDCMILVYDETIKLAMQAAHILEKTVIKHRKPLLIICEDVIDEAFETFVLNRVQSGLPIVVVKGPGYGDRRKYLMEDIVYLCGGQFVSPELGFDPSQLEDEILGHADRVIVNKDSTTILVNEPDQEKLLGRITQLQEQMGLCTDANERLRYQERLAKLTSGVAVIKIGASSEPEMIEKKHRYEDALNATTAAREEGIVPGGGFTLLMASKAIDPETANGAEKIGMQLVKEALLAPAAQIAQNAGYDATETVKNSLETGLGFDANKGAYGHLSKDGIVDPAKVTKSSLLNAVSIAKLVLTTECVIVDGDEKS